MSNGLSHSPTNDTRLQEFMAETRELGRQMSQGKDSLPNWAIKLAYAAADGVIDLTPDKHGEDDVSRAYKSFVEAASKKAVHEHTTNGVKANVSKARQIAKAAQKPSCDFVESMKGLLDKRQELIQAKEDVRSAYPAIVHAARTQNGQDDDLTPAQIDESIRKPQAPDPDLEKVLGRIEKQLADVISGEKGVKCDDDRILKAHELVRDQLATLVHDREVAEVEEKAIALGLIEAPAAQVAA